MTVTATLKDSSGNSISGLGGNTTILFRTCWANFTDLSIFNGGTFGLCFIVNRIGTYFNNSQFNFFFFPPLPPGENMSIAFTLNEWSTQSRGFTVKNIPTTLAPTTTGNVTNGTTTCDPETTTDDSIFGSGNALSAGCLCLISVIYSVACCSDGVPIC